MSLRDLLRGTGVAIITPFNEDTTVDYDSLRNVLNFVIDGGVQYIVSLGTTGETPTLSKEEKTEIINFTFSSVAGRVPVVVGIGGNNTEAVITDIETLPIENAAAILSASPHYNKPSQEGIYQHYKAIAASTNKPLIMYNVPGRTGSNMLPATTVRLAHDIGTIAGIKESSGNFGQIAQILRDKPLDFMVVSGDDNLALAQIALGMDGVISVASNCFPKEFSSMVKAALENDYVTARALNSKLLQAYELLFAENSPAGAKAFLTEMGAIKNHLRLPLVPLSDAIYKQVQDYLPTLK